MDQPYPGAGAMGAEGRISVAELAEALPSCRGCDLAENGSRPVFGAGPENARVVIVGEQPGDIEERRGEPFVGPAGKLLDRALEAAGIDRSQVWVTNSVLHFKFTQRRPASAVSTRRPTPMRWPPANPGWRLSSTGCGRSW